MTKRLLQLNSFNAVAAGQTATIDLPTMGTYHALLINYGTSTSGGATKANMEAEIEEIRLKVNGKIQRRFTAEELFDMNEHKGMGAPTTGYLQIYFAEPWRRTVPGEDVLAWSMGDVDTFQMEIDIASGATSPTLSAKKLWTPENPVMGPIVKWRKHIVPVAAIGTVNLTTLDKTVSYVGLHAKSSVLTEVEIKIDQETRLKSTLAEAKLMQANGGRTQVSGWFNMDFDATNRVSDVLSMTKADGTKVSDFQIDFTMSSATSFTLISEIVGMRD